jgi:enamine deaminase RidA (YjgF/YER057c/UK114 family)
MLRIVRRSPLPLLGLALVSGCAMQPPAPTPPPAPPMPQFVVPAGTEFVSDLFGYAQAVRVGPWVTTSAIPGFDIEKRGFPEDYASQVREAFENLRLVLEAAGASLDEVVELSSQQLDMDQFNTTVDGKFAAFGEHKPTWTATGVKSLPLPSMQFQVTRLVTPRHRDGGPGRRRRVGSARRRGAGAAARNPGAHAAGEEVGGQEPPALHEPSRLLTRLPTALEGLLEGLQLVAPLAVEAKSLA